MGTGIQICGFNGSGKSTLGRILAERLNFYYIDNEDLYFTRVDSDEPYQNPKSRSEVESLLMDEVSKHPDFVFSAVRGDYGNDVIPMYNYVIVMDFPKEIRSQRVRNRSYQKFGSRMLAGGDLHRQEEIFFQIVDSRQDDYIDNWLQKVRCPIIRVDGTKPVADNVEYILKVIKR